MNIQIKISKRPISYTKAINFMNKRVDDLKKNRNRELLWILEHPTSYTAGIRFNENEILDKKIKIIKTNRGGKITLHNPGQKIIYFVIDLNKRKKDIRLLLKVIETSIIEVLKIYNIDGSSDKKNIGIWVKNKKISAIGIKVKRWIAYHGCSININNDLSKYKKIIPCGLSNDRITSFDDLGVKNVLNLNNNIKEIFVKNLTKI